MPSRAGEPPGRNWKNCAAYSMNTRGETDDNPGARNLSRITASAWLDAAPLCMARSGFGGALYPGEHAVPAGGHPLCPRGDYARADDGRASDHLQRFEAAQGSGRSIRGAGNVRRRGETGRRRIRHTRSERPVARYSNKPTRGHPFCGGMVPGSHGVELAYGGGLVPDGTDAAQRDQARRARALSEMHRAATQDGIRTRHPVLRM